MLLKGSVVCALVRYSPEICELSRVINHKTEDFISTLGLGGLIIGDMGQS